MSRFLEMVFGLHLYCVVFQVADKKLETVGMVMVILYATDEGVARKKAYKKIAKRNVVMIGNWHITVEQI